MSDPTSTDSVTVNVGNADLTASAETPAPAKSKAPPAPPRAAFKFKRDATLSILVNPLIWVLFILDFVFWLVLFFVDWPGYFLTGKATMVTFFKFWFSGLRSHPASVGGGRVLRRDGQLMNYPFSERENTVHHCVQKAFEQYAHLKCMGTRTFVRMEKPEGSKFPLKVFGDTTWKSYVEVQKDAQRFGKGLLNLGIVEPMPLSMAKEMTESFSQIGGPHCMLIFEETCREWQTACLGCMGQSVTVATSYATLGMPAVAEALQQTRAPVILCNYKDVAKVAGLAASCPDLKAIVYTRNCVAAEEPPLSGTMGELRVLSFDDVINSAPDVAESDAYSPPEPDHVGLIVSYNYLLYWWSYAFVFFFLCINLYFLRIYRFFYLLLDSRGVVCSFFILIYISHEKNLSNQQHT